jgi:predicted transcriptional regulator
MLVQIEKKESAKLKPWMSMEVSVEQIQNELLNEKLVEMADDRFELTELGRRFIREFKQVNESEK